MTIVMHTVGGQQWRCRSCGVRSCCGQAGLRGCRAPAVGRVWNHDWVPMGTGKPVLRHVVDPTPG